jgi:hypothetical protein
MRALAWLMIVIASEAAAGPPVDDWRWLRGDWIACRDDGVVEESWLGPRDGLLIGANLSTTRGRTTFEHLRIARDEAGWTYWGSPMGRPAVPFVLVQHGEQSAIFENAAHGFPARIVYRRDGTALIARIEGMVDGAPREKGWRFEQGRAGERCR